MIANKSHKDYRKFGVVSNIYMPHGFVWVSGLNLTRPIKCSSEGSLEDHGQGFVSSQATEFKSQQMPLNYRDVKLLKYGQYLIDASKGESPRESGMRENPQTNADFDPEKLRAALKEAGKHRSTVFLDYIESAGLLETINPRMVYRAFDYANFSTKSWEDLGASRECIKTKAKIKLPIKQRPGGKMGESEVLSAYNELGSSDFSNITQYSHLWNRRDEWTSASPWHEFDLEDCDQFEDEQSQSNPKTWQEMIRGEQYEEDKHIFQYKPLS